MLRSLIISILITSSASAATYVGTVPITFQVTGLPNGPQFDRGTATVTLTTDYATMDWTVDWNEPLSFGHLESRSCSLGLPCNIATGNQAPGFPADTYLMAGDAEWRLDVSEPHTDALPLHSIVASGYDVYSIPGYGDWAFGLNIGRASFDGTTLMLGLSPGAAWQDPFTHAWANSGFNCFADLGTDPFGVNVSIISIPLAIQLAPAAVPEPSTLGLIGCVLLPFASRRCARSPNGGESATRRKTAGCVAA